MRVPIRRMERDGFPLTLRVPKGAFVLVATPPATVSQKTVERHFGVPPRVYEKMAREGAFPVKMIEGLSVALYEDVKRAVTEGAARRVLERTAEPPSEPTLSQEAIERLDRLFGAVPAPRAGVSGVARARGGSCTWCPRPAYATKQEWTGEYWSGAPVCEVCAKKRAPNERIVDVGERAILLPAKDPSVPEAYDPPRRRKKPQQRRGGE